jgi:uncharacterized protein
MSKLTFASLLLTSLFLTSVEAHFLWKIDGEKPSYLYGTVHSSDPLVREIPAAVMDALAASETFHPELEFSPENLGSLTAAMFAGGDSPPSEKMPPQLWERVLRHGERSGIPAVLMRRVPLQFLPVLVAAPPEADFNRVVDVQLYQQALDREISIHPLESVEEQLSAFQNLSREEVLLFLGEALTEAEQGYPTMKKTLRLYSDGNLADLESFLRSEFARYDLPDLEEALLNKRNRLMAERLLPYLKKGGAFVAVGVGHYPGDEGLVALLQREGYTVTPVSLRKQGG